MRDLFGSYQVGAIHGRLLTAWSLAGVLGPFIINGIADSQEASGHVGSDLYQLSFYVMIGLLVVGFLVNELVRPVDAKHHEPDRDEPAPETSESDAGTGRAPVRMVLSWACVGVPFAYGVYELALKVLLFFE